MGNGNKVSNAIYITIGTVLVLIIGYYGNKYLEGMEEIARLEYRIETLTKKMECLKENTSAIKKEFDACKTAGFEDNYCAKQVSGLYCKADAVDIFEAVGVKAQAN